jgi:hypothetical protein
VFAVFAGFAGLAWVVCSAWIIGSAGVAGGRVAFVAAFVAEGTRGTEDTGDTGGAGDTEDTGGAGGAVPSSLRAVGKTPFGLEAGHDAPGTPIAVFHMQVVIKITSGGELQRAPQVISWAPIHHHKSLPHLI